VFLDLDSFDVATVTEKAKPKAKLPPIITIRLDIAMCQRRSARLFFVCFSLSSELFKNFALVSPAF
jgi:hypothetical protein